MDKDFYFLIYVILLALRIIITIYCVDRARKLNRSEWGWGFFGFFLPIAAIIWIKFMKPRYIWTDNPNKDTQEEDDSITNYQDKDNSFIINELRFFVGLVLITLGIIMLVVVFIPNIGFKETWPLVFVVLGVTIVLRRNRY